MWFWALQTDLARTWLSAMETATKTCTDASQACIEAWTAAASPSATPSFQLPFPFNKTALAAWSTNPFLPFGATAMPFGATMMPWMAAPWFASLPSQWSPMMFWQPMLSQAAFPWNVTWSTPWQLSRPPAMTPAAVMADLMSASYRTATGHAAAAITFAPLKPKSEPAQNWFGWPLDAAGRGYLN